MGLSLSPDNLSSERARPMYSTRYRVNGRDARLLDRRLRFGPANQTVHVTPQKELSNTTTFYPLRLSSHIGDKPSEFLNSRYHII